MAEKPVKRVRIFSSLRKILNAAITTEALAKATKAAAAGLAARAAVDFAAVAAAYAQTAGTDLNLVMPAAAAVAVAAAGLEETAATGHLAAVVAAATARKSWLAMAQAMIPVWAALDMVLAAAALALMALLVPLAARVRKASA